jgi:MoaA/NifB/PqqE/SkfB family radical SAM enzyme
MPFLGNIGLMLTYRCTIACPHCVVEAGPHRCEDLGLDRCLSLIDEARAYRQGHIVGLALTGGEPFYNLDDLAEVSAYGQRRGFVVSVVTNGYWATTRRAALETLAGLPAIRLLSISTDVYHQKAIPFGHVRNAIWAARQLGRFYNIAVCTDDEEDEQYQTILHDLEAMGDGDRIQKTITFPVGRAKRTARHFHYRTSPNPTASVCPVASTPVVFPGGDVTACIGPVLTLPPGHPLHLGNVQEDPLSEILDRAEMNEILHIIRVWGPHRLVSLLRAEGLGDLLAREYLCNCSCDVCFKLFSDARIVDALHRIVQDQAIQHTIAYARVYYLDEMTMAERYGLGEDPGRDASPAVYAETALTAPESFPEERPHPLPGNPQAHRPGDRHAGDQRSEDALLSACL